jgi:hypothetical protein
MLDNLARSASRGALLAMAWTGSMAAAQTAPAPPPAPATKSAPPALPAAAAPSSDVSGLTLDALTWLRGCWLGAVNRREFREQWSPARGGMMVGFSHTVISPREGTIKERMAAKDEAIDPSKE